MSTKSETVSNKERVAVALHQVVSRVESNLVQGFKEELCKCWNCGFSPVRLEVTLDNGNKEFCYSCPNMECGMGTKSPKREAWKPIKQLAANYWNEANVRVNDSRHHE